MKGIPLLFVSSEDLAVCNSFADLQVDGILYKSVPSMQMFAERMEGKNVLESAKISIPKIGYNFEALEGMRVKYFYYLEEGCKIIQCQAGIVSKIISTEGVIILEIQNLFSLLEKKIGTYFSEKCRANLGDSKCKINVNNFSIKGTISSVFKDVIHDENLNISNPSLFLGGRVYVLDTKEEVPVIRVERDRIYLFFALKRSKSGHGYQLFQGCNKTLKMCSKIYNNAVNFRGEPFIFGDF